NDNIVFLRRLVEGGTNKSYGIQVARLAGVPDQVIIKAKSVLNSVENADRTKQAITPDIIEPNGHETVAENPINQMDLFSPDDESLRQELKKIDISSITPLEALNILNNLKQKAMT
ncbi:MAG: DNA mismatch repair protein MutS, partial [Desulfobacteraceae bacterium]